MPTAKRVTVGAVCVLCTVETLGIIAYYGSPVVRTALAAVIGLAIIAGVTVAITATLRGDLVRHHTEMPPPPPTPQSRAVARVYDLHTASLPEGREGGPLRALHAHSDGSPTNGRHRHDVQWKTPP